MSERADLLVTIGLRTRERREALGLTQGQVAKRCGWDESGMMVSHFENARRLPSLTNLLALSRALGCTPNDLLDLDTPGGERIARDHAAMNHMRGFKWAAHKWLYSRDGVVQVPKGAVILAEIGLDGGVLDDGP